MKNVLLFLVVVIISWLAFSGYRGFYDHFYKLGSGHAFTKIMEQERLPWATMTNEERKPYQKAAFAEGKKCAFFMVLGQYIPGYLFVLIMVGFLTPSFAKRFRVALFISFWGVWVLGVSFLSLGSGYWGQAPRFPTSLISSIMIYSVVACIFGVILLMSKFLSSLIHRPQS